MAALGFYRIDFETTFQTILEGVLGPWIASQLRGNDDLFLERLIAERRRLVGQRPMLGQYPPNEETTPQEITRRTHRILHMEQEMLMAHRLAEYRGWLRQMENPVGWNYEDYESESESDEAN
ncbi:19a333ac-d1b4-4b6f-9ba5-874f69303b97-CDS [Sclerotinia trifoliorum]|uniref:19a333ac-d1b4-4b6f-9ba5-874f69303b97-CDS n=1 Tax=Sclerotinia trifoliorum TaxID=28548 RepID=A0A8H2ZQZ3_9HELO|nr:19a333ac-d1b4-4b6f-9ba5-874f69303b97-CDS [Sclerotinia trifoliorum]